MRPSAWSRKGFLGETESLEAVIAQDAQTLARLGITHEQVAEALEAILSPIMALRQSTPWEEHMARQTKYPNLYEPETIPHFSLDNLPDVGKGYLVGDWQVFVQQYRGFQGCPWGCQTLIGTFDFMILNRKTGEYVTGPSLVVHLIREHHFFEGTGTPFRTDPLQVSLVLGLVPKS